MEKMDESYERRRGTQELYKFMGRVEQHLKDSDQRQDRRDKDMKTHCENEDVDRKDIKEAIVDIQLTLQKAIICPFENTIEDITNEMSECREDRVKIEGVQENHIKTHKTAKDAKRDNRGLISVIIAGVLAAFIVIRDLYNYLKE